MVGTNHIDAAEKVLLLKEPEHRGMSRLLTGGQPQFVLKKTRLQFHHIVSTFESTFS